MSDVPNPPIGTLTDRVQLQRRDTSAEDEGGQLAVFTPMATVWARVRGLSERQGQSADGRSVSVSHAVVMRFRTDLSPGDRIVHRGRKLEVVSAEDLNGGRAYLSCACSETSFTG
jgi:SPP1 family predicted phage head-tail adaptor